MFMVRKKKKEILMCQTRYLLSSLLYSMAFLGCAADADVVEELSGAASMEAAALSSYELTFEIRKGDKVLAKPTLIGREGTLQSITVQADDGKRPSYKLAAVIRRESAERAFSESYVSASAMYFEREGEQWVLKSEPSFRRIRVRDSWVSPAVAAKEDSAKASMAIEPAVASQGSEVFEISVLSATALTDVTLQKACQAAGLKGVDVGKEGTGVEPQATSGVEPQATCCRTCPRNPRRRICCTNSCCWDGICGTGCCA